MRTEQIGGSGQGHYTHGVFGLPIIQQPPLNLGIELWRQIRSGVSRCSPERDPVKDRRREPA
jgi:hypothetical protein